ncbi:hypothetical protein LR961_01425 [Stenotrophomonas sp. SY1]|nr:hypothetical protein [Stenotrophomonas sp. SY1]
MTSAEGFRFNRMLIFVNHPAAQIAVAPGSIRPLPAFHRGQGSQEEQHTGAASAPFMNMTRRHQRRRKSS